ncbi:MAG: hypothetical protein AAGH89_14835, partial [Verrucomicrobiota bacterium]
MNRIYQGRVGSADVDGTKFESSQLTKPENNPLWRHHEIFQDAVNYYLVALGALADPNAKESSRLVNDLLSQLERSWDEFPRKNLDSRLPKPRPLR